MTAYFERIKLGLIIKVKLGSVFVLLAQSFLFGLPREDVPV